jgi:hypothetical protein
VNLKRSLLLAVLVLGLVVVLGLALRSERVLLAGLPTRVVVASEADAWTLAGPSAVVVLGTGSMAPYIPAAPKGADPLRTVSALVVLVSGARYADIAVGSLVIYVPRWAGRNVMHQAAQIDAGGWIMTGLGNKDYETKERVTAANFVGIVARTYVWGK